MDVSTDKSIKREYDELLIMKQCIESTEFQKFIMQPLYEELNLLKEAYNCESLRELSVVKGKKKGLEWFIERLKQINSDFENKKFELESQDK